MVLLKISSKICFVFFGHVPKLNPSIIINLVNSCQPPKKPIMSTLVVLVVNTEGNDLENTYSVAIIYCFEKTIAKTLH